MYLRIEHPANDIPPFVLVRAKAAAEEKLSREGLTLSELANALEAGCIPPPLEKARDAAVVMLNAAGHDGVGVVLVLRKDAKTAPAEAC